MRSPCVQAGIAPFDDAQDRLRQGGKTVSFRLMLRLCCNIKRKNRSFLAAAGEKGVIFRGLPSPAA
jgi:hypothetical protein